MLSGSCVRNASAFALLGPYAAWMDEEKSYRDDTLGGPMSLDEEYRWNIPVITYGFDQSFRELFGLRGIQAVDEAIKLLNELPPASEITNDFGHLYIGGNRVPTDTARKNFLAEALGLLDLKSAAMGAVLEQLGLTMPERYIFCVRDFSILPLSTNIQVVQRNFDPISLSASASLNGTLYYYYTQVGFNPLRVDAIEYPVDPFAFASSSVAGSRPGPGEFYSEFTRDDVGGLRFLLSQENRNVERVVEGARAIGSDPSGFINTALRPGVEKIAFKRMAWNAVGRQFVPLTNVYVDRYVGEGGLVREQTLNRVLTRPDILFAAQDLGLDHEFRPMIYSGTSTASWENNAALNSLVSSNGPGVIRPGVLISFNRDMGVGEGGSFRWGSFDGSTNGPVLYPVDRNKPVVLIPAGSRWRFYDHGTAPVGEWKSPDYADGNWSSGLAQLGYGDDDERTIVGYGPNPENKYVTTYFRHEFFWAEPSDFSNLTLRLLRDDGAIVYLNGHEVFRSNMAAGEVTALTPAASEVEGEAETRFYGMSINSSYLRAGQNVVAVEVHQANRGSSDISFDLQLSNEELPPPPVLGIERIDNVLLLRWPSSASQFSLFSAGSLLEPLGWIRLAEQPTDDGTWKTLTIPVAGNGLHRFFRLGVE